MNQMAAAMITEVRMNTPPAPILGMPIRTPATAGPMTRVPFIAICCNTTAFGRALRSTTSPVNAMRAGPMTDRPQPCTVDARSSIQYSSAPNASDTAIITAESRIVAWQAVSTAFFGKRSATTPPIGASSSMGTPNAMNTPPRPALSPVSSIAIQPWATCWACIAKKISVDDVNRTRNCSYRSAAKRVTCTGTSTTRDTVRSPARRARSRQERRVTGRKVEGRCG